MRLFIRLAASTPLPLLHGLGIILGWLTYALSPSYRLRLRAHIELAGLPRATVRRAVAEAGKMVAELPYLWLRPNDRPLGQNVRWQGREHLDTAYASGRGVLLLTPHLGCFEVAAQACAETYGQRWPITVLYRPARQVWLREWVEASRARPGLHTAPSTLAGVRQMIRALRKGEAVGLLPDQVPPRGLGVWVPFFGRPAYTMTLAARLAQQTGATVMLIWGERLARGAGYVMHVRPLTEALPDGDPAQSATVVNRAMEQLILECPEQYLWGYNRYKQPRAEMSPVSGGDSAAG